MLRALLESTPSLTLCNELEVNILVSTEQIKQMTRLRFREVHELTEGHTELVKDRADARAEPLQQPAFAVQALALPCNRASGEASLLPPDALQVLEEALPESPLP